MGLRIGQIGSRQQQDTGHTTMAKIHWEADWEVFPMNTRSPAVAGMVDSWRQVNLLGGQGHRIKLGVRWQA